MRARVDTSAEEAVLKTALADTIDGVEEEDIGDSTCTDARRRLSIGNATGRRRLDGSASVAFDITIDPSAVGGSSPDEAVAAIHTSLSTAADTGALTSNIQAAASSSGNSNLASVSVASVGVASSDGTNYVKVDSRGCEGYVHMDYGDYGGVWLSGVVSLDECAEAVRAFDGQDDCRAEFFFYEDEGRCNCPTDACELNYENENAGGEGQLYQFTDGYVSVEPECSQEWCTSDYDDCWAGTSDEACTCSNGQARLTGESYDDGDTTVYEYTCCTSGPTVGEECGDCCTDWTLIIVASVGGGLALICCAVVLAFAICYKAKLCCFEHKVGTMPIAPAVSAVEMTQFAAAQPIDSYPSQHAKLQQQPPSVVLVQGAPHMAGTHMPQQHQDMVIPIQQQQHALQPAGMMLQPTAITPSQPMGSVNLQPTAITPLQPMGSVNSDNHSVPL